MIFENPQELKERIESLAGRRVYGPPEVKQDTSSYMSIIPGEVLRLEGDDYYVFRDAKEGRFGIEEQPKFWVKYVVDLTDGARKILKMVFHERFSATLGDFAIRCVRNPDKESAVLELVRGDDRFMQGRTVHDSVGNNVRVLDVIRGKSLFNYIGTLEEPHESYYHETLPGILRKLVSAIEGLDYLQQHDTHHGDVRNDHIYIETDTGHFRWIDFDLEVNYLDYDIWSVGNLLTYAVGKGIRTCRAADRIRKERGEEAIAPICPQDALLFYKYRMANLRKIFPFVSADINELLMRFSTSTDYFYEGFSQIAADLKEILDGGLL